VSDPPLPEALADALAFDVLLVAAPPPVAPPLPPLPAARQSAASGCTLHRVDQLVSWNRSSHAPAIHASAKSHPARR